MWIAVLGPLEIRDDSGAPVTLVGARLRTLLARLTLTPERAVSVESLLEAVWGENLPASPVNALQSLVFRLRKALFPGRSARLESHSSGYRLRLSGEEVDHAVFERLVRQGVADHARGERRDAADRLTGALGLWRAGPYSEFSGDVFEAEAARLSGLRLRAVEHLAQARIALGEPEDALAVIAAETEHDPPHERLSELRMRALRDAGRPAEALALFERVRIRLDEELGAPPALGLRRMHEEILRERPEASPTRPVKARPRSRGNLMAPITDIVGREEDTEQVARLLRDSRLVTLVGPGGVGKSRLAAEVARSVLDDYPDGVWRVELAGVSDPAALPRHIAAVVGRTSEPLVREPFSDPLPDRRDTAEDLAEKLAERCVLLLLDDCEHLVEACAHLAETLLGRCAKLRILVTSRELLAITGEALWPVRPLPVPRSDVGLPEALTYSSVRLLLERVKAVRPGFEPTEANLPAVLQICRRLDGLPLAIELAGARARALPVEEVAPRLDDRFRLLTGGSRVALPRHRTLLAVVEWGWELLHPDERTLARRLAVFPSGAVSDSVVEVCAGAGLKPEEVPELLDSLVDKSFVQTLEVTGAPTRYGMLDTLRAFALDVLNESGELDRLRQAHMRSFRALAERAEPALRSADQAEWIRRLQQEYGNLTAALRWAVETEDTETAVGLVAAQGWFWILTGAHADGLSQLDEALSLPVGEEASGTFMESRATAFLYTSLLRSSVGDRRGVRRAVEAAKESVRALPAGDLLTLIVDSVPPLWVQGSESRPPLDPLVALTRHTDPWWAAMAHFLIGSVLSESEGFPAAVPSFDRALVAFETLGDRWNAANAAAGAGKGHSLAGEAGVALSLLTRALRYYEELGADGRVGLTLVLRSLEYMRLGNVAAAQEDLHRVRTLLEEQCPHDDNLACLVDRVHGEIALGNGSPEEARAHLLRAADHPVSRSGRLQPSWTHPSIALGRLAAVSGDHREAQEWLRSAAEIAADGQDRMMAAAVAEAMAVLALARERPYRVARMLGAAEAARGGPDQGSPEAAHAAAKGRSLLGARRFEAEFTVAASADFAQALAAIRTEEPA